MEFGLKILFLFGVFARPGGAALGCTSANTWCARLSAHRRCSTSGAKLRVSSWVTNRFTKRSASRKSFFRPRRPQFDSACARGSVPNVASATSRVWPIGAGSCFRVYEDRKTMKFDVKASVAIVDLQGKRVSGPPVVFKQ
jgi:hypothetical protein